MSSIHQMRRGYDLDHVYESNGQWWLSRSRQHSDDAKKSVDYAMQALYALTHECNELRIAANKIDQRLAQQCADRQRQGRCDGYNCGC